MIAALIIVFREVIEAGLIVGVVMAATVGVSGRGRTIVAGVLAGVVGACLVALFAGRLSEAFAGSGQELFNAAILGVAVLMLTWHNVWMARHGRALAAEMREVGHDVATGRRSLTALAVVVGVAVLREGFEVVLFLYGVAVSEGGANLGMLFGGLGGLVLGVAMTALTYFGLLAVPARHLFMVTSVLIAFVAAGLAAQAVAFLAQANVVTALDGVVWDSSWLLADSSLVGRVLHTLLGYTDHPTQMQIVVYVTTLAVIFVLMKLLAPTPRPKAVTA